MDNLDHQVSPRPDPPRLRNEIIAGPLADPEQRDLIGLQADPQGRLPMVIELNLQHARGLDGALAQLTTEWSSVIGDQPLPAPSADIYCRVDLTMEQVQALVNADLSTTTPAERAVYRVWPDFPLQRLIDKSWTTVKADAARRSYDAAGRDMVWAVVDSGIDGGHPHFTNLGTLAGPVASLHRDFTLPGDPQPGNALEDELGHGTHVAGIIAGALPGDTAAMVYQQQQDPDNPQQTTPQVRQLASNTVLAGIAPQTRLVSLKVMSDQTTGSSMNVVRALEYIRTKINGQKLMRVHGVNLSVGYEFIAKWFACGQSPICVEVNRLVRSGVVVVIAAGNTGYGMVNAQQRSSWVGLTMTINDPGNADLAITVGATHRDMPHTYGVSYFSSKGPTGDGRLKPDLVAPGERITSCGAGAALGAINAIPGGVQVASGAPVYVEDSGTSMAAPHVSGAIAAFLSIRQEFIGQPDQVKQIFTNSATSLGRERYFEGHGLVDLMRAIQSV